MEIVTTVTAMRGLRRTLADPSGLVPTMGALHEGHLSLVRESRRRDATTVVTIFVNPAQFSPDEDLNRYPRDPERDLVLLEAEHVGAVFMPPVEEIYPDGYSTHLDVDGLSEGLEGTSRPGHFRGVATVVAKLFNITAPARAYFGRKDAQQFRVIRRMAADLDFPVELVPMPTVREPDGLAMSSRNVYLTPDERAAATCLSRGLFAARERFNAGERDASRLRDVVHDTVAAEPLVRLDYVSVADDLSLAELATIERTALLSLAAFVGRTRLIDNVELDAPIT